MNRWNVFFLVVLSGIFMARAELTKDQKDELEGSLRIVAVNDDTVEKDDVEYIELKVSTNQKVKYSEDYTFYMRITVELTDKKTSTVCYTQFARERGEVDVEYTGEDEWQFLVSKGDLKRPKVTGFVVQYGVIIDKKFTVLAEEMDDVDTLEELTTRTPDRYEAKPRIFHQYFFEDSDGEVVLSGWM